MVLRSPHLYHSYTYRRALAVVRQGKELGVDRIDGDLDTHYVNAWEPLAVPVFVPCVIVPTRNEAHNVEPLVARLTAAFGARSVQVLFVDDSDDDTPTVIADVAARATLPVRLVHRQPGERCGGLGGAVLAGLRDASERGAEWAVVMDGDLQHPPEVAPELLAEAERAGADVMVASRYVGDGTAAGLSDRVRVLVSRGATSLSKVVFPQKLRQCSDPMSGFLRRPVGVR